MKKDRIVYLDPIVVVTEDINLLEQPCKKLLDLLSCCKSDYNWEKISKVYYKKCLNNKKN